MMTIDEAIAHAEEMACGNDQCAKDHAQLADWLRELVTLRAENEKLENRLTQYALFSEVVGDPAVEFASLRRELHRVESDNTKLREQIERLQPIDCEGNALDIADTVHMLRSEYDGDHEWDDVVVELALTKWGGDRWIVRGSKGEAWACDCLKTGYDEDAYEGSDDAEPIVNPSLVEVENEKLKAFIRDMWWTMVSAAWDGEQPSLTKIRKHMDELRIEVYG